MDILKLFIVFCVIILVMWLKKTNIHCGTGRHSCHHPDLPSADSHRLLRYDQGSDQLDHH